MKSFIAIALTFLSMSASADCWQVEKMHGTRFSQDDNYASSEDGYSGKFMLTINGDFASVTYSGADAGSGITRALSPNSIITIGMDQGKTMLQTWTIQGDGTVMMTKTVSGYGSFDGAQAMIGKVTGKC